jgi:hypothetical protein
MDIKMDDTIRKFITNIVIGQKIIDNLSETRKKNDLTISYFLNHLMILNAQKMKGWDKKLNYEKYESSFSPNIHEKLADKSSIKMKDICSIEPYCKKPMKIYSPSFIFKRVGFHFRLIKLESDYYTMLGFLYYDNEFVGYICFNKKLNDYKSLYIVISKKYSDNFYKNRNRKALVISDIIDKTIIFDAEYYKMYMRSFRNMLYSVIFDVISEYSTLKNIVLIGEECGGNLLQLFLIDLLNNKNDINIKISENLTYYMFMHNTAMLSNNLNMENIANTILMSFNNKNAYNSWEIKDELKKKYNFIFSEK